MKKLLLLLLLSTGLLAQSQNLLLQHQLEPEKLPADMPVTFSVKANEQELKQYLRQVHGTYKYAFRGYHNVSIPAHEVKNFIEQPFITQIDYHYQHPGPLNDSMRVKARVNQVQQGVAPLPQGYKGRGVLVGFIDDGIDFNHPDFQDSSGHTRVLAIWDQTQPFDAARTPSKYGYGQVWDSTDIENGSCTSIDASGHGTTVAGTSAGNGLSTGTHWGCAPESFIVMVKSNYTVPNWSYTVADAVDYIFHVADSLGMPCSINSSVGDYYGTHDGTDLAAQYIDSLLRAKRGRLMSAALGNSGTFAPYHLSTNVTSDTSFTWFKYNAPSGGDAFPYGVVFFEAFADTAAMHNVYFSMGADQVSPVYQHRGQGPFRNAFDFIGTTVTDTIYSITGNRLGIVDYYADILPGGILDLQVHMKEPDSSAYYFRFSTTGSGTYDVWSAEWLGISDMVDVVPSASVFPDLVHYVSPDSLKIMVDGPQCLESVVTVANYNNIQNYIGYDGNPVSLGEVEGDICSTSSRGPTRDNRLKPDLAATGNVTFSPGPLPILSALISVAPYKLLPDGMHMRNGGTSMAAPVLTGIGALMLERCPQTNWLEFKTNVNTAAFADSHTGTVPNFAFGYGKVSAFDAMIQTVYTPVLSGDTAMCAGDVAELLAAPGGFQEYVWSNGDTTYYSSLDSTGTLWFTGTDAAGCKTDTATISVTEYPIPVITITSSGGTLTANGTGSLAYQWYVNGNPIAGENSNTYTPPGEGNFYVTGSDPIGCTGYSDTVTIAGIGEINALGLQVYPNPFNEQLLIVSQENFEAEIRNGLGELVLKTNNKTIQAHNWSRGIYLVRVVTEKGQAVFRLVKE